MASSAVLFGVYPLMQTALGMGISSRMIRDRLRERPAFQSAIAAAADAVRRQGDVPNAALAGAPADMTKAIHLCRGNFEGAWVAEGGYEPVAEVLLADINVDGYFMEFDSDRAGGFQPLRFLPKGKTVVLGLITTKSGALETSESIKARINEAAKVLPLDQLALSPQCGFASGIEGMAMSIITPAMMDNSMGAVRFIGPVVALAAFDLALEGNDQVLCSYGRFGLSDGWTPRDGKFWHPLGCFFLNLKES
jgi:hypothetical protein